MFKDRHEAGKKLAERLQAYRGTDAVVLALPRGGVVLGYEVAKALALPLDIIAVRKIGHAYAPEYAVGAIDESGTSIFNAVEVEQIDGAWLKRETEAQKAEAKRRGVVYRAGKDPIDIAGKAAIIVDDGIATGLTMRVAVRYAVSRKADVIVAVPVAPAESLHVLAQEGASEVLVLEPPEGFAGAVGAHYAVFDQVDDEEVVELLKNTKNN